ncbi:hypothetical protein V491_03873, partial [Pseudogymnoascus sp. VKM F-3775]
MHRQLEDIHILEHCDAVEATDHEEPTIMQHRAVVSAPARRLPVDDTLVPLHVDEVEQHDFVAVLDTVVAADDEEVGPNDCSSVGESRVRYRDIDGLPEESVDVKDPDVTEAFT